MTTPTPEAIEAAARAIAYADDYLHVQPSHERLADAALTAAAPFIVSAKTVEGVWTMTDAEFRRSLAQAKAEAWDEGFEDGKRQDFEGDDGPRFVNPYHAATIEGGSE